MFDSSGEAMGPNDRYMITEPTNFAKYLGKAVARESGFDMKEFKKLITVKQIKNYIKECAKREGKTYSVNYDEIDEICLRVHEHIIGFDLTKAAAKGVLDMYWDDKANTMMFRTLTSTDKTPYQLRLENLEDDDFDPSEVAEEEFNPEDFYEDIEDLIDEDDEDYYDDDGDDDLPDLGLQ